MFNERGLKEAFEKVKFDILMLGKEVSSLRGEILDLKNQLEVVNTSLDNLKLAKITPAHNPTDRQISPTEAVTPTHTPTVPMEIGGLKYPNFSSSNGNRGVPTDRQTNQQTDQQAFSASINDSYSDFQTPLKLPKNTSPSLNASFLKASEILDSLDSLKKEIRLKFKTITQQEMLVFSSIYQLEEKFPEGVEYRQIALRLGLSESSIRDYVQKISSKGVPILKEKLNNKKILLKISPELKKMATLDTLIKLREL